MSRGNFEMQLKLKLTVNYFIHAIIYYFINEDTLFSRMTLCFLIIRIRYLRKLNVYQVLVNH